MRFDTRQSMKMGQQMKLAPRMIQSMEILQMPLADLLERIEQELEGNIALEIAEPASDAEGATAQSEPQEQDESFERLDDYASDHPDAVDNEFDARRERTWDRPSARLSGEPDAKMEAMANAPARGVSLGEQLAAQWSLVDVDPALEPLGRLIIDKLEEDGYLRVPLEQIAGEAPASLGKVSIEDLGRALRAKIGRASCRERV